jgi:hypothetical protein
MSRLLAGALAQRKRFFGPLKKLAKRLFSPLPANKAIDLYNGLLAARQLQLHAALAEAVNAVGVVAIDRELHDLAPTDALNTVAALGLRGELVFPVPVVIKHTPALLGYYRMLLGLSKKEFGNVLGYSRWVAVEERGGVPLRLLPELFQLCAMFTGPLVELVSAMGRFDERDLSDLALLTLGPTLQGGRNNVIGAKASKAVIASVRSLVEPWITGEHGRRLDFDTPTGRRFSLVAASDPDLRLDEHTAEQRAPVLAVEIKGGGDSSNAHNRAGEAEKSQIKARSLGFAHRWTVIVMGNISSGQIKGHTPTSTAIFEAREIIGRAGPDWDRFKFELMDLIR